MSDEDARRGRRTTLKTFRFSEELALALEEEAKEQGITLNALASSILTKHAEWDAKAGRFGLIPIYKPIFAALLGATDDETLNRIGRTVLAVMWKEMASFWLHDSSGDGILDFLSRHRQLPYVQTEIKKEGRDYTIVFHHDLGPKWSIVLHSALDEFVRKSFHAQPTVSVGDTVVTAQFVAPQADSPT